MRKENTKIIPLLDLVMRMDLSKTEEIQKIMQHTGQTSALKFI